jgi:hypothetical protein
MITFDISTTKNEKLHITIVGIAILLLASCKEEVENPK